MELRECLLQWSPADNARQRADPFGHLREWAIVSFVWRKF
jgi:hypothetical protein